MTSIGQSGQAVLSQQPIHGELAIGDFLSFGIAPINQTSSPTGDGDLRFQLNQNAMSQANGTMLIGSSTSTGVADQTPGQSGLTSNSDWVVWKCLIIGCGTSNSRTDPLCGSCQYARPDAQLVSRARRHQQAVADRLLRERQAIADEHLKELDNMRHQHEHELRMQREQFIAQSEGQHRLVMLTPSPAPASAASTLQELTEALAAAQAAANTALQEKEVLEKELQAQRATAAAALARMASMYERELMAQREERAAHVAAQLARADEPLDEAVRVRIASVQRTKTIADLLSKMDLRGSDLYSIAYNGDMSTLLKLDELDALDAVPEVNKVYNFACEVYGLQRMTALCIASCRGNVNVVQVLLNVPGIDVSWADQVRTLDVMMSAHWLCSGWTECSHLCKPPWSSGHCTCAVGGQKGGSECAGQGKHCLQLLMLICNSWMTTAGCRMNGLHSCGHASVVRQLLCRCCWTMPGWR